MSFINVNEIMNVSKKNLDQIHPKIFFVISLMGTNVARNEWKTND
jgi:hypothetical protein